jgi:hypothetical protein
MQLPYVHINGTSPEALRKQYREAWDAVDDAIDALAACEVHDRDYYPIGNKAGAIARTEHRERMLKLGRVREELEEIILSIQVPPK